MNSYDEELFTQIYEENSKMMLKIAYGYVFNYSEASDIVQNVFLKFLKTNIIEPLDAKFWLIRVTINESINYVKSAHYRKVELNNEYLDLIKDNSAESIEEYNVINQIPRLKEIDQKIINLYYFNNLSLKEIASILNKSEEMVKKRIQRAREKLKELVGQTNER